VITVHDRARDRRRGAHRHEVLFAKPGLGAARAHANEPKRLPGSDGQGQRGPYDLPSAFTLGAVDLDHGRMDAWTDASLTVLPQKPSGVSIPLGRAMLHP
jgi:hypothetical protein